jgi:hypothetical protein
MKSMVRVPIAVVTHSCRRIRRFGAVERTE